MRFFRDFFTENLPVFLEIAGKNPRHADSRKGGARCAPAIAHAERTRP
jgi:hypothetical protein